MEPKKVSKSLALRKVAALTKGDLKEEDCVMISFLVGIQTCVAEEILACKLDLVVASEYFQGLLRSPFTPAGPIRIKHVEPEIFRLVIEFINLSGQLVSEVNDLEQWLKLAAAADEFLLDELGQLCTEKLVQLINVDNTWEVFSKNHLIKYTSAVCEKLLSSRTEECLKKPAFLKIHENALVKFLKLKEMSIKSEMQLVLACLEFVSRKEHGRAVFRRCALPHLRLLTLSADNDLAELIPFLEKDEKMLLILNNLEKDSLHIKNDLLMNTSHLCKNTNPRNPGQGKLQEREDFVPAELLGCRSKICQVDYRQFQYKWSSGKFSLTVEGNKAKKTVELIDFLDKIDEHFGDNVLVASFRGNGWIFGTTANVTVTSEDGICNHSVNLHSSKNSDQFKPIIINMIKGGKVQVEVTINKAAKFSLIGGPEKSLGDFYQELQTHGHKKFSLVEPMPTCDCPHLDLVKPPPEEGIVFNEGREGFSERYNKHWICLTCYKVFQARLAHRKQHFHPLALGFSHLNVWCIECEEYVDTPTLYEAKNAAHLAKFGTEMPWTYRGEIKIE